MTGDVDVRREASVEVLSLNGKIDDKCGADVRAQQDLVKSVGDCNGVSHREEEEVINNGIENGNGNGKDEADGTYVFVKGSEAVGEGVGNSFVVTDQREESIEGKAIDIDVGGLKVSAGNGNCDVEQAAVNGENGDGEGKLVNGEIGDHLFDEHIVVNKVEIVEQEGNAAHMKENNEETVVDEAETDAGHGKAIDLNDVDCHVEDHLMDNRTGVADSQGEFIESTLAGSTSADEQNCEADIVVSTHSKQHEGEFHIEKQPAAESSLEMNNEFAGSCDATVAAFKCENTFEAPQADEADSSGQMGGDQKSSLEVEPSLEASEELSGSCDVMVVASECERTSEVPQTDQGDFSGQVDEDQKSELQIEDSGKGEVLGIDVGAGDEDEKVVEERKSCPDIETEQNYEPERISEVPQADQADSSGQVDNDQKSELKIKDSGEGEVLKIDDGAGDKDEKVMEERKSCPDVETEQNHEPDTTLEVPQANRVDSSGQVDEDQKSELEIEDSGEGEVLKINDGAGNEDEKIMEERNSCPDKETERNHEPEGTFEVPMADQADSSGKVDEDQKSESTIVDSGQGEFGKVDDGVGNEDEKVMEESISCPDVDTEKNPEPESILTKGLVSGKENPSTKKDDDYSSEAAPEDISMNSNKIATADTRAGPFSDDTGDIEPPATEPDFIASENVEHEDVTDALDTSQEINEEARFPENTESTPSSVSCGNVPVQIGKGFLISDNDRFLSDVDGRKNTCNSTNYFTSFAVDHVQLITELEEVSAEKIQTSIPQCVDANLEVREENDATVVDVTSSCSATNLSAVTEICFGSISQKEISSIPSDDIAEPKGSNSLSESTRSYHIHATECPSNDTAENESFSAQDCKLGLKNELDAVLDEKREDQSTIENDKPAFSQAEGDDLVAQNDAALAEVSSILASEEQIVVSEVEKKLFNVLVKIPRYDDENMKQQINEAQLQVTEKTQSRDAIQAEIQIIKAVCKEHSDKIELALSEENAARELLKSKREEIEAVQSVINKVKSAIAVGDYDVKIQIMEQKIQHETLPLKEEKQLVRDIKLLKLSREQLSNDMGGLDELKVALDQREQTEERLKSLRREADLLRENVLKAEAVTKSAKRKYSDERDKLRELQGRFRDADKIRQEAYIHLKNLRKQSYEKNKYFWKYKDDVKMSIDLASKGNREALSRFCIDQVETVMELWNESNDFREEYLRCNASRTLRRLGTADGRSLGPNEAMPAIHIAFNQTAVKDKSMSALPSVEQEKVSLVMEARPAADDKLPMKEVEQKKQKAKNKNSEKAVAQVEDLVTVSSRDVVDMDIEEPKLSKEEEELAKKAEELRKAEEAALLMEQRRLEEKAKAKEALERKKRNAERALARAASKAQKEAEQKEKEKEKKAKKKERKKAGGAMATPSDAGIEGESALSAEVTAEAPADFDTKDKPAAMVKRPQKPLYFVKQTKVKPIPPTLRNRGKRKMQPWMWAVLTVLLVFALFLVSNGGNFF